MDSVNTVFPTNFISNIQTGVSNYGQLVSPLTQLIEKGLIFSLTKIAKPTSHVLTLAVVGATCYAGVKLAKLGWDHFVNGKETEEKTEEKTEGKNPCRWTAHIGEESHLIIR